MTQLYVPVMSVDKAEELSRLLYLLTNPPGDAETKIYSTAIISPSTGDIRLPIDSEEFYINPGADKHLLDDYLQVFVNMGIITSQEIVNIQNLIELNKDSKVNLQLTLPLFWYQQLKSYEDLVLDGWFENSEII